jgi:hypothetical protein
MGHAPFRWHEAALVVAWAAVVVGQVLAWVAAVQYVPKARAAWAEGRAAASAAEGRAVNASGPGPI